MSTNQLMQKVESRDDAILASLEEADEDYCTRYDEFEASMTFDVLLEAMVNLPDSVKKQALHDAVQAKSTDLFAKTYERLLQAKTGKALQEATNCARQLALYRN